MVRKPPGRDQPNAFLHDGTLTTARSFLSRPQRPLSTDVVLPIQSQRGSHLDGEGRPVAAVNFEQQLRQSTARRGERLVADQRRLRLRTRDVRVGVYLVDNLAAV